MTVNTQFYFQPLRTEAELRSVTLIMEACSQFLPFKQTVREIKWDGTSASFVKTAGKWQANYSRRLQEPSWSLFSAAAALMRLRRGCWWKIINSQHWFTRVGPRHCLSLPYPDPLFCHSDKDINVTWLIRCNEVRSGSWRRQARQIPACLSKQSGCQLSRLEEFPLSAPSTFHDAQRVRWFRNPVPVPQMYHFNERLVFRKNHLTGSGPNQHATQPELHLK